MLVRIQSEGAPGLKSTTEKNRRLNQVCFLVSGTLQCQQMATPAHPRRPVLPPDRTTPTTTTTSCYWARRRSWRRGTAASWTTGSPSRSCWRTGQGRPTGRRSTTPCSLWPRCEENPEESGHRRHSGSGETLNNTKEKRAGSELDPDQDMCLRTLTWYGPGTSASLCPFERLPLVLCPLFRPQTSLSPFSYEVPHLWKWWLPC